MLSKEIEKEIQQENKVLLNFTLRQLICLSAAVVCSVLIAVFLGISFSLAIYPCLIIGVICFAFGWVKQDGIPMERILLKRLQTGLYQNNMRVYKSKNRYVSLLNKEYERRRVLDLKDKNIKKKYKRELKNKKKAAGKSRLKRIV